MTRYLAVELAPKGIIVNGVAASAVLTEALKVYTDNPERKKQLLQSTPAGRMVEPDDIADVVAFLCSPQASMICGQIITVDGGRSITPPGYDSSSNEQGD